MTGQEMRRLRVKMLQDEQQILKKHIAMVATFAVKNNITLGESAEIASDIMGSYGQFLLDQGHFDRIKREYEEEIQRERRHVS